MVWYLRMKHYPLWFIALFILIFGTIEGAFLVSNLDKLAHGGWITLLVSSILFFLIYCWSEGRRIRNRFVEFASIRSHLDSIRELRNDESIPRTSTHLANLTSANNDFDIENSIIYSIFRKKPTCADVYWLLHVDVADDPYRLEYKVIQLVPGEIIKIDFRIGFRIEPRINLFFRQVVADMHASGEVDVFSRYASLKRQNLIGDFRFVVIEKFLSYDNVIGVYEKIVLSVHNLLKKLGLSDEKAFGLDTSNVLVEKVPIVINPPSEIKLKRI